MIHSFLVRIQICLNFSDFEPRNILNLFLNTKGVTWHKNLRNLFQSLLMFNCIINLSKSLHFLSIMQSTSESSIITVIQKFLCPDEA